MISKRTKTVAVAGTVLLVLALAPSSHAQKGDTPLEQARGYLNEAIESLDGARASYDAGSPKKAKKQVTKAINELSQALELFREEAITDPQRAAVDELRQSRHKLAQVVLNLDGKNYETAEKQFQEAIDAYKKAKEMAVAAIDS